jgi:hypothetical protein
MRFVFYCTLVLTLVLATVGFEPPLDLDIELDYLLALIGEERRESRGFVERVQ